MNENSLKQLNGYMENLQKPDLKLVRPIKLTFYIRDTKESSEKQPGFVSSGTVYIHFTVDTENATF